ncbi:MAG: hypothetical protein WD993_06005 [Thermoleophilaceae bacterium]
MTRRDRRPRPERLAASQEASTEPARGGSGRGRTTALQAALLAAVFAAATGLSLLAGAANAGTALGVGQIAFTIVLAWLLLRR